MAEPLGDHGRGTDAQIEPADGFRHHDGEPALFGHRGPLGAIDGAGGRPQGPDARSVELGKSGGGLAQHPQGLGFGVGVGFRGLAHGM